MRALCATMLVARIAAAEPRVVIVETADAPALPGLATQVQVHVGPSITVGTVQDHTSSSMTFASRASTIVDEQNATIVVWVATVGEPGSARRTLLVFAAGRWPGRALIELVRIEAAIPASEVERTVALKIASLFDTMVTARPITAALGVPSIASPRWRIELVGSAVLERGDRGIDGRTSAAIDRRWSDGTWTLAAGLGVYWQPSSTIASEPGVVAIDELAPTAAVGIERQLGAVTLFVRPHASAAFLLARGRGAREQGSAAVFSPAAGADVGIRWRLSHTIELLFAAGAEAAFTRQQFLVDGEPAADLRTGRAAVRVGLSLPLR